MPSRLVLSAVALAGVLASVVMVVVGLPEATPTQVVLLELSSLPLSIAVAAAVAMLHQRATRPVGQRSRVVLSGAGAAVSFGLVLMAWAYQVGPRGLVHTGQLLVWLGLLAALLVMLRRQPRQRLVRFSLPEEDNEPDALDDAPDDDPDAPADRGAAASL